VSRFEIIAAAVAVVFYLVGFVGHHLPRTQPLMLRFTPGFLLVFGLAALIPALRGARPALLLWGAVVLVLTFLLEAAGTATGRIFGPYRYGKTLGPRLLAVPLVIAFNWLLVILGAVSLSQRLIPQPLPAAVLAAALAAGFDVLMEPTAVRLDYWTWQAPTIPLQNYAAWFLIALAAALTFTLAGLQVSSLLPAGYFLIQLLYFTALRLFPPLPA
jgi:putative membrane protein